MTSPETPEIGTTDYYRNLAPYISVAASLEFKRTHIWNDEHRVTQGLIDLGGVALTFHTPAQVSDLITKLAELETQMQAESARAQEGGSN